MTVSDRKLNIEYALVQGFYWMGYCVCMSYAAVFLQGRGYSNFSLGLVLAIGNVTGFLVSPNLAAMVDKGKGLSVYGCIWLLMAAQFILLLAFSFTKGASLLLSVLYCLYIASNMAVNPMNTQLSFELGGWSGRINYGAARGIGSLAYSPTAVLLGSLSNSHGSDILPYMGMLCLLLQSVMLTVLMLQNRKGMIPAPAVARAESDAKSTLDFVRANPRFTLLLVGAALLFFSHNIIVNFMVNIVRELGGDNSVLGGINGFMALMELPTMLLYASVARRRSCSSLLRFSVLMFTVKALGIALAPSVGWLYAVHIIQSLSFALYTPAIVQYTSLVVGPGDSAKGQALAYGMTTLGSAFASGLGGLMYDSIPVRGTLLVGAAVSAVGVLLCELNVVKTSNR